MELIIYLAMAVLIFMRLYSVFGRIEKERQENQNEIFDITNKQDTTLVDAEPPPIPDYLSEEIKSGIKALIALDSDFTVPKFIKGANSAFELLFQAYVSRDLSEVKTFVSDALISKLQRQLKNAKGINKSMLITIDSTDIVKVDIKDKIAELKVVFETEQIRYVEDENKSTLSGDPQNSVHVTDFWTLRRDTDTDNPNWQLIAME